MLLSLSIRNYALIRRLDIAFGPGFSVITGETGAGKSIMLGALGLLLGERADGKAQGEERTVVEGVFDLTEQPVADFFEDNELDFDGSECIVRREISAAGKSRAFINDTPVTLSQLRELAPYLVDIHSQHRNLLLADRDFQLDALDTVAQNSETRATYKNLYQAWRKALQDYEMLRQQVERDRANYDYLQYQLHELETAQLAEGEQEELEQKARLLEHSESIRDALNEAAEHLTLMGEALSGRLHTAHLRLDSVGDVLPAAAALSERLESCRIELDDIADELSRELDNLNFDPAELDRINVRLDTLYALEKKHRVQSLDELINLRSSLSEQVDKLSNSSEQLHELQTAANDAFKHLTTISQQLTKQRTTAARLLEQRMVESLQQLGMPSIRFVVSIERQSEPTASGCDRVTFLFSANAGTAPQSLAQTASGGEMARVMLALKAILSGPTALTPIIFDEIDTGVSGRIAQTMADLMKQMSKGRRQIISITHLPQIAAAGAAHYFVYKTEEGGTTETHIRRLTQEERIQELAHLLSGKTLTEAAVRNAQELLNPAEL